MGAAGAGGRSAELTGLRPGSSRRLLLATAAGLCVPSLAAAAGPRFRNAIGQPDLEGVWSAISGTGLERPPEFKSQWVSIKEAQAFMAKRNEGPPADKDKIGQFVTEWWDTAPMTQMAGQALTSFIVDPPDGQLPYSDAGRTRMEANLKQTEEDTSGPEARDTFERCLSGFGGPPLASVGFGSLFKIVQTRTETAILSEVMHDMRLIRIGSPAARPAPRTWNGASSGRYEGDTLQVETTGFHTTLTIRAGDFYLSPNACVRERFRRHSQDELLYEFEIEDPAVYTQSWRAMMLLRRTDAAMFEYACHEGNYGMANILAGAREEEKAAGQARQ